MDITRALDRMQLTKSEQLSLEHYQKKPEGRGFFAVAETLARHKAFDDAIQLLLFGIERHPSYSVARVFLAQLFFKKHFFKESWNCLDASPSSLKSNLSAQILRLKLSVILGFEAQAHAMVRELSNQDFQDQEAKTILDHIHLKSFRDLKKDYAEFLGVKLVEEAPMPPHRHLLEASSSSLESGLVEDQFRERVARGFFVSQTHEIFRKRPAADLGHRELDALTRARLARRQGLYQSAFEIYEKLAYAAPSNELLRREWLEVKELREAQKLIDRQKDPQMAEAIEKVRSIDRKLHILHQLLDTLDAYESTRMAS